MLLEQVTKLKLMFLAQEEEFLKCEEANNNVNAGSKKMQEILEDVNKDPTESFINSIYKQISDFHYDDDSRPVISPVPNDFEGTIFASSLMTLSDHQMRVKDVEEEFEPFLSFTNGRRKKTNFKQSTFIRSHILTLRI